MTWVFNPVVDRLLKLHRDDRVEWIENVRHGMSRFPALSGVDWPSTRRALLLNDALNRLVFRFETRAPALAKLVARAIPLVGSTLALRSAPKDRPLLIALAHFGPVHLVFATVLRCLGGRKIYVMHAGGDTGEPVARYLRRLGAIPMINDETALRKLGALMSRDRSCVVAFAFDYMGNHGRRAIPFLGSAVQVGRGLAYLADTQDALVFTAWGESMFSRPRVNVTGPYELDRSMARTARQDLLIDLLFAMIEDRVAKSPAEWTEWLNCAALPERAV